MSTPAETCPSCPSCGEPLWTRRHAADFLQMSESWVYKRVEDGTLPHVRLGGRLRFVPAELRDWVLRQREPGKVVQLHPGAG